MSVAIDCGTGIETAGTPPPPPPLIQRYQARLAALADIRWQHEVAGITIEWEGQQLPIKTARADRTEAWIAASQAAQNPAYTRNIKLGDGLFVTADATAIITVATLIDAHVQACFDNEKALTTALAAAYAAEDGAALDAVDITAGWPGAQGEPA